MMISSSESISVTSLLALVFKFFLNSAEASAIFILAILIASTIEQSASPLSIP